jgi:hypothetical protein
MPTQSNAQEATPPGSERRAWVRFPCDLDTECYSSTAADQTRWWARLQDVSQGGLRLIVERRFEPGTILNITVEATGDETPPAMLARVVHVNAEPGGLWALGCRFARELSEKDLEFFVRASGEA